MSQPGWTLGQSALGVDTFLTSPPPEETQRQTYQAFFHCGGDGKFTGYIREVGERFATDSDHHLQAGHILAERLCYWAHGQRLTRLPEPLPFLEERPEHVAAMGPIEVAYKPEAS